METLMHHSGRDLEIHVKLNIMKKILPALLALTFVIHSSYAQTVDDVPIKEIGTEYIQIVGREKLLSNKVNVEIDFGQGVPLFGNIKHSVIKDEDGKKMEFNSMVRALNFFSQYGYEFVQAYTTRDESSNTVYYLMRKRKAVPSGSTPIK